MKKVLCVLLCTLMIAAYIPALGESDSDTIPFSATFTNLIGDALDYTSSDWYSSAYNRATLTVCLALDLTTALGIDDATEVFDVTKSSYVGKSSVILSIVLSGKNNVYLITYVPILGTANYGVLSGSYTDFVIEYALSATCDDGYSKIDLENLLKVYSDLSSVLASLS